MSRGIVPAKDTIMIATGGEAAAAIRKRRIAVAVVVVAVVQAPIRKVPVYSF
jgi:hypothetical protein